MPRTPAIRYYDSRKAYYTKFNGRQRLLAAGPKDEPDGPTYLKAISEFSRVMHADELQRAEDNARLSAVITWYYHHLDRQERTSTLAVARSLLDPAALKLGQIKIRELKPFAVHDWIDGMVTWNSSTKHRALSVLSSALYWAKNQRLIATNPLADLQGKPEPLARGKEAMIPEELEHLLISHSGTAFSLFLRLARGTGARPGEIANAHPHHYRDYGEPWGAIAFPWNPPPGDYRWKCAKKTKRDRFIFLTPDLKELVDNQIAHRGGKGPILLSPRGKKWRLHNLWAHLGRTLSQSKVREWIEDNRFDSSKLTMYSFRHTYITRMLLKGCPIKLLADWCGTSMTMIERHYSHGHDDPIAMGQLFVQFSKGDRTSSRFDPSPGDGR